MLDCEDAKDYPESEREQRQVDLLPAEGVKHSGRSMHSSADSISLLAHHGHPPLLSRSTHTLNFRFKETSDEQHK